MFVKSGVFDSQKGILKSFRNLVNCQGDSAVLSEFGNQFSVLRIYEKRCLKGDVLEFVHIRKGTLGVVVIKAAGGS